MHLVGARLIERATRAQTAAPMACHFSLVLHVLAASLLPLTQAVTGCDAGFEKVAPAALHALTAVFNEPLVDRTDTLHYAVPTKVIDPIPAFNASFD